VRLQAARGDIAVAQPGIAHVVHGVGEAAAVGIGGGQGAVVAQDIRQYLQRGRPGLIG
jgi:hypothetical protein